METQIFLKTQSTLSSQGAGPPSPTKPTQARTLHPNFHLQLTISEHFPKNFWGHFVDHLDLIRAPQTTTKNKAACAFGRWIWWMKWDDLIDSSLPQKRHRKGNASAPVLWSSEVTDPCSSQGFPCFFFISYSFCSFIYTPHDAEFQPSTASLWGIHEIGWSEIQGVNGSLKLQAPKTDPSYFHNKKTISVLNRTRHMAKITALAVIFCLFPSWLWDLPWFTRFARNCLASREVMKLLVDG